VKEKESPFGPQIEGDHIQLTVIELWGGTTIGKVLTERRRGISYLIQESLGHGKKKTTTILKMSRSGLQLTISVETCSKKKQRKTWRGVTRR